MSAPVLKFTDFLNLTFFDNLKYNYLSFLQVFPQERCVAIDWVGLWPAWGKQ